MDDSLCQMTVTDRGLSVSIICMWQTTSCSRGLLNFGIWTIHQSQITTGGTPLPGELKVIGGFTRSGMRVGKVKRLTDTAEHLLNLK
jgi:hypothetical protein